jgi:glucose/arabinose dehydrogenase
MGIGVLRAFACLYWLSLGALPARAATPACDADDGGLTLPQGFCALVVADGLGPARQLTIAPNGDVYVAIDGAGGGIVALRDNDGDGRLEQQARFGDGGGTGVRMHDDYLYYAPDTMILRYRLGRGDLAPRAGPEVVVDGLPAERVRVGRPFEIDLEGYLYVDLGQPSSGCVDGEQPCPQDEYSGVWRFRADELKQSLPAPGRRYSTGNRDGIANAWNSESAKLYVVQHGGPPAPGSSGTDADGATLSDGDPLLALPPEWSADDVVFYEGRQFPGRYRGGAFVAVHGAGDGRDPQAYRVAFTPFAAGRATGEYETFATGFTDSQRLRASGRAPYRPVGLAVGPDGSLYVSDGEHGRIWRVLYRP